MTKEELSGMDIKEIAKRVRADIAAAIKAGKLPAFKTSVSLKRYSGGQSLTVEVTGVPAGYTIPNVEHVRWHAANPRLSMWDAPEAARARLNREADAHLAAIKAIVDAYNWDESDLQSDYFHVNFYAHIRFGEVEREQRAALEAAFAA